MPGTTPIQMAQLSDLFFLYYGATAVAVLSFLYERLRFYRLASKLSQAKLVASKE